LPAAGNTRVPSIYRRTHEAAEIFLAFGKESYTMEIKPWRFIRSCTGITLSSYEDLVEIRLMPIAS
jgi:hypothetical protein